MGVWCGPSGCAVYGFDFADSVGYRPCFSAGRSTRYEEELIATPICTSDSKLSACQREIWCQRRDSNSQTPVSKTGCYSNSHTLALWCTGEDLNLRVPLGETGLQPVRFGRAHAPVQTWRKVDESNAHRSSRCPGFQDQLPAIQQYLPHGGEYGS